MRHSNVLEDEKSREVLRTGPGWTPNRNGIVETENGWGAGSAKDQALPDVD